MPEISRFFGIVIAMYHREHAPPHFHVFYSGDHAVLAIPTSQLLRGQLPPRAMGLVVEWAARHQTELQANWELAKLGRPLKRIPPLE